MKSNRGFSLLETLLYLAIFAVVGGALFGILTNVVRVSTHEISGDEVSSQLQFAMGTITRLVKDSSSIEISTSTATTTLKLRMSIAAQDPTCITLVNGVLKLAQGPLDPTPGSIGASQCTNVTKDLTTDKVVVDSALFKRIEFPGGHDQVAVDMQMSNTATGANKISRALRSGISRASAATFDSDLLPNATNQYEVGSSIGKKWKNISLSGLLNVGTSNGAPAITAQTGSIYYDTGTNSFKGYNGASWNDIGPTLWVATSTNMYSNISGNVGIGTTAPAASLDVGGFAANGALRSVLARQAEGNATGAGTFLGVKAWTTQNTSYGGKMFSIEDAFYGALNSSIEFYRGSSQTGGFMTFTTNNGTEHMRIDQNGNVGIGTTAPAQKLEVNGTVLIDGGGTFTTTGNALSLYQSDPGAYRIGFDSQAGSVGYIRANVIAGSASNTWGTAIGHSLSASSNTLVTDMFIGASGNVGIGTTNPAYLLDVNGSVRGTSVCIGTDCRSAWPGAPAFRGALVNTIGMTLNAAAFTTMSYPNEGYDTDNIHDTVTNPSRLTVPAGVSKVRLVFKLQTVSTPASVGYLAVQIRKNGTTNSVDSAEENFPLETTYRPSVQVFSPVTSVVPGDYFEAVVYNSTAALTAAGWFGMEIVQ